MMKTGKLLFLSAISLFSLVFAGSSALAETDLGFAKDANGNIAYMTLKDAREYCTGKGAHLADIRELATSLYPAMGIRMTSPQGLKVDISEMDIEQVAQPLRTEIRHNAKDGFKCQSMYDKATDLESCGFFYNESTYVRPTDAGVPTTPQVERFGTDQKVDDNTFAWSDSMFVGSPSQNFVVSLYAGQITVSAANTETYHGAVRCMK